MIKDGNYSYDTHGSCARNISFSVKDGKLHNIQFLGGCNGNLKMISKLLEGTDALESAERCSGNLCGNKGTSCADQLSKAIFTLQQS